MEQKYYVEKMIVPNQVDETHWEKRMVDTSHFAHEIKFLDGTTQEMISCSREMCFFCNGEKFARPLQELYDANFLGQLLEGDNDCFPISCRRQMMTTEIFRNWEDGLDAWGNRVYTDIKGCEND